jgi:predicted RNA-binding protein with PUA-like domain
VDVFRTLKRLAEETVAEWNAVGLTLPETSAAEKSLKRLTRRHEEEARKTIETLSMNPLRDFVSSCENSPIRNRLLRLTADSPDLLAIIKQEGKVQHEPDHPLRLAVMPVTEDQFQIIAE